MYKNAISALTKVNFMLTILSLMIATAELTLRIASSWHEKHDTTEEN